MLQVIAKNRDGFPFISGHRGAAGYAPENTMAAFRKGWDLGADLLELDVQLTRDGHVIVVHDHTLERTTNGKGMVHEHTLAELKELDAGSWYSPSFASERIPTLDELAAWAKGKVRLNIEIKSTPQTIGDLPEQVAAICRNHGIVEETEVISFDHVAIKRVKAMEPNLAGAINFGARLVDPVGAARAAAADVLNMHWAFITPDLVELAHDNGLGVQCFMNDPELAKMLAGWGVDFMDADFPDRVKAAVRAR
jgi:glycerophosphoryl diester phosphodiesterase